MSTPNPQPQRQPSPLALKLLAMRRKTRPPRELPPDTVVRTDAAKCTESGCTSTAVVACAFKLYGKLAGTKCGRVLCMEHGVAGKNPALCGPHRRHPRGK